MEISLNYYCKNRDYKYRAPYYNGNPNIGPRIIENLDQYPDPFHYSYLGSGRWGWEERREKAENKGGEGGGGGERGESIIIIWRR